MPPRRMGDVAEYLNSAKTTTIILITAISRLIERHVAASSSNNPYCAVIGEELCASPLRRCSSGFAPSRG